MEISSADIKLILTALQDAGFDQAEVVVGDVHIAVARRGIQLPASAPTAAPAPPAEPAPPVAIEPERSAPAPDAPPTGAVPPVGGSEQVVASPSVGVFRRVSQNGGAPFVEIGQNVTAGDVLGNVKVLTLTMPIEAMTDGVVTAIAAADGDPVEYGTPLVTIAS
ncbi:MULTISPECIES: acetyl-CoA carboxylase biotin carboxyl carrier protein [Rhodococcus]|uniref:acetyl-CoA carboxylase biotin carboxyl carrier protein n=1 Tax=Rhodococcus TaxID=1827 RepID=UPI00106409EA|nr:biotin/lipoyl-containing protein [Rhodococcus opacus]NHU47066.1 acetyl-CoA carboxylase biotin carboxyl carrier protein [Rhodococcus sp. A14]RYF40244.1 MAG: acetyl-CoA carboxylase biotin carboxyl carrier protein [Comamonadaceae bacterium]UZG59720.1 hypothetical protein ONE62_38865 [Rhodococcus opacus]